MTMDRSDYSARDYEREAQTTRRRLASDLDELSDRLTPGQVFDEMLTYARSGSGSVLRTFSNAARENPIPTLLIGAGCMLFLTEKMGINQRLSSNGAAERDTQQAASARRGVTNSLRAGASSAADFVSEQASSVAGGVRRGVQAAGDSVDAAGDRIRRTAHDVRDQVSDVAGAAVDHVRQAGDVAQDFAATLSDQIAETTSAGARQARRAVGQLSQTATNLAHEQPLLVAAVGVAVGAIIAAALPRTETEDELMGETSDALKRAASEAASEQYDQAKRAAGRVFEEARTVAEQEGLTPAAAAEALRSVGDKVVSVATQTADAAQSEARDLAASGSSR